MIGSVPREGPFTGMSEMETELEKKEMEHKRASSKPDQTSSTNISKFTIQERLMNVIFTLEVFFLELNNASVIIK